MRIFKSFYLLFLFFLFIGGLQAQDDIDCSMCHEVEPVDSLVQTSVHAGFSCAECHNHIAENFDIHEEDPSENIKADCYMCHEGIAEEHKESIHGLSLAEGIDEAAQCWDCHGSHQIQYVSEETSSVHQKNLAATCGNCHNDPDLVAKYEIPIMSPSKSYDESVHGKLAAEGELAPTCATCHGVHDIKGTYMVGSKTSVEHIGETCGECHSDITEKYENSIHWIRAKKGVRVSPVCNDCHSEHSIQKFSADNKRAEMFKLEEQTCFNCHQDPLIAKRFGVNSNQTISYMDSYHGMAAKAGDTNAALCTDCHGVHEILPAKYDESTVHPSNLTETCASCHPDANDTFAQSYGHDVIDQKARMVSDWVEYIYIYLIILVIGGMAVHNLLIYIKELKEHKARAFKRIGIKRFNKNEIIQHIILLVSFLTLVVTGFALKYPDGLWDGGLQVFGITEDMRQVIHRVSAVILIAISLYHIYYIIFNKHGKRVVKEMLPRYSDIGQVIKTLAYYTGLKKEKPEYEFFSYIEKAEYWALIWGTVVMTVTGFVLWFPTLISGWAPLWLIKVSEIIHFYEAILATLAIVVWHWFFVIFRPSEYPMSFAWINGKLSFHEFRHHHTKRFNRLIGELEAYVNEEKTEDELSYFTVEFLNTLKENNIEPSEVINNVDEFDT